MTHLSLAEIERRCAESQRRADALRSRARRRSRRRWFWLGALAVLAACALGVLVGYLTGVWLG